MKMQARTGAQAFDRDSRCNREIYLSSASEAVLAHYPHVEVQLIEQDPAALEEITAKGEVILAD